MRLSFTFWAVVITHHFICNALNSEYYPIFATESSFQLNLDEEITHGSSVPSVSALEENIFAVTWAGAPATRNIDYNENIYCRLFYMSKSTEEPQLLLPTITITTSANKSHHSPRISALSDHNNQISDSKRFAIVWHSDDMNGDFDGIYAKIIRWDYEEANKNQISVIIQDELKPEFKVNDATDPIIGELDITPIFDIGRFAITWLVWRRSGHIETYDVFCKVYDNYGSKSSPPFMVDIPSSKRESEPSMTPVYISGASRSTYVVATWSVYDDVTAVTAIYSKLMNVGSDLDAIPQYEINETVMDGGVDVFTWNPSNGMYDTPYHNEAPDATYLMNDYMIIVWSSTTSSMTQSTIHTAIYYVNTVDHAFVNVYDGYMMDHAVHDVEDGVNYYNPKVNTLTCYQSDLDYTDFKNIDGATDLDRCDVSICYQYDSSDLSKTYCSFWRISKGDNLHNITMHKYYENDVEMTEMDHDVLSSISSWNRFYGATSSPINAKLLIVEQVTEADNGYSIFGRMMHYGNWSLEHPPRRNTTYKTTTSHIMRHTLTGLFMVCLMGVLYVCYYKKCRDNPSLMSKDIMAVNKEMFQQKTEMIVKQWSRYKNQWNAAMIKRQHQEVSGIDTDEEEKEWTTDPNYPSSTHKKAKFQISGDSYTDSDEPVPLGGRDNRRSHNNMHNDSSNGGQYHTSGADMSDQPVEVSTANEEEVEHSRVVLLQHEQYDVFQGNLSSDESVEYIN
eukprot:80148_1